ncbi:hypothetical protein [Pseudoalteromonas luteoviolacea]|uniref:Secreted protein n=1 Tax=Pseudoalteromonas luteoviolacea S4054 TaxID=1129367 RepID=A0A0F6AII5_9GAMM|nr:hypothetical protein [Pseudoalteromonas luteoviolacea]AOT11046.1 hypothetical protein S4054249_24745 [Pseudoalteromonas luteoviolacea]AOT15790.1 hypothetical protein S40542_23765 [Pseudoalteromonas luteoviolacea]AOT20867.1 hypothetical protein S4054_24665 [Pseudoalteromonas luteoviolacea]KKE85756.1 hypothetical protein N479_24690 [Pseudoalteromonas luteoviolacea S4054]KZN71115.1 hypothetical protein N481_19745 [Pseudoalteromonas luteoviolacea S4047-1]
MIKLVIAALMGAAAFSSQANTCSSIGCTDTIETLFVNEGGQIYVGTPGNEKLANCSPVEGNYFSIATSSSNRQELYSLLLLAYSSKERVQLRVKEGTSGCTIAYARIDDRW